jgi:hypothetical protein
MVALLWLAACEKAPTATPLPTPTALKVAITPALQPIQGALTLCARAHPEIALFVDEIPAGSIDPGKYNLSLRLGLPDQEAAYAVSLGQERIDVIVSPENRVQSLDEEELRAMFSGSILSWERVGGEARVVQPWVFVEGAEARAALDRVILKGRPVASQALVAAGPTAMLAGVADDPGAIGYLPHAWLQKQVKALQVGSGLDAALRLPVLAISASEPQAAPRRFLACLQSGPGKAPIQKIYSP